MLKFGMDGPLGPPGYTYGSCTVFHENFAHSAIFYVISRIYVYFTKKGISNTTWARNLTKKSTEYKFKRFC